MPTHSAVEHIITQYAPTMAAQMLALADQAHSEEEVRHGCNSFIECVLSQAGLTITGRHEYGLKGGRIDSKYGAESADDIVLRFLSNASSWRGEVARRINADHHGMFEQ